MRTITFSFRDIIWIALCTGSLAALVLAFGLTGGPTPASDIEEINSLLDEFQEAYSGKHPDDLRQLFCANAVIAYDEGGRWQRAMSLEEWIQSTTETVFAFNDHISDVLTDREIVVYRNIAYCVCNYTYSSEDKTTRGMDVFTFIKIRDRWRIVSLQWTGDEVE